MSNEGSQGSILRSMGFETPHGYQISKKNQRSEGLIATVKHYFKKIGSNFYKDIRLALLIAFSEELLGNEEYYEAIAKGKAGSSPIYQVFALRKLVNPIKWLQALSGIFYTTVITFLHFIVDIITLPLTLILTTLLYPFYSLFFPFKKDAQSEDQLSFNKAPEADKKDTNPQKNLTFLNFGFYIHHILATFPKKLLSFLVGFVSRPIEVICSPINRAFKPFENLETPRKAVVVAFLLGAVSVALGFNLLLGFTLFSHTCLLLLLMPPVMHWIVTCAGFVTLELIAGAITMVGLLSGLSESMETTYNRRELYPHDDVNIVRTLENMLRIHYLPTCYLTKKRSRASSPVSGSDSDSDCASGKSSSDRGTDSKSDQFHAIV